MAVTSAQLTAGFRGAFYNNGQQMIGCYAWWLERETTLTEDGVLDQKLTIPVEQSLAYQLKVSELMVDSSFTASVLSNDVAGNQMRFLFIGESRRNDGQIERVRLDGACISAALILAGIERGATRKRDLTFRLDTVPSLDSTISAGT